jgi:hypothetical protein
MQDCFLLKSKKKKSILAAANLARILLFLPETTKHVCYERE